MPTVSIPRDQLFELLEQTYTEEEFDELCFEFGLELDDVVSEKPQIGSRALSAGVEVTEEVMYKIEIPANRYDLLCLEGLAQALRVFLQLDKSIPAYALSGQPQLTMQVQDTVTEVRPFVYCAVLRGMQMTKQAYQSLIDLQEKLHQNICRKRTLVAIGTHDLDKLRGPFTYEGRAPHDISFVPLSKQEEYNGEQLMQLYEEDAQLKKYLHIIRDKAVYPVIYDADQTVLSMPPIINGDHSKISLATRDMLIECTATDKTKASIVLNVVVAMFSKYCERQFSVEPVTVSYSSGETMVTPDFSTPSVSADVGYVNRSVGVNLTVDDMVKLLRRMQLPARADGTERLMVDVPIIRSDVLHECDVMCDVAVAYGFNRVEERMPATATVGKQQPLNHLSDLLRREGFAQHGFTEVLTWVTVSHAENFDLVRRADGGDMAVRIGNPKTLEFEECRTSLLPGLLKTLRENRKCAVPIRLFEVGDVVLKDATKDVLCANRRRACAIACGTVAGFEVLQGVLEACLRSLGAVRQSGDGAGDRAWSLVEEGCDDGALFDGRRGSIVYGGRTIGAIGWVHPEVLKNFSLNYPCSAFEFDVEAFL